MRVFLTGATGLIGSRLAQDLTGEGHEVVAVSRRQHSPREGGIEWIVGDVGEAGSWCDALDGCDAVVHLAGESVATRRWTAARKRKLVASRVEATRLIVDAMSRASRSPRALVCASACGFYGARGDEHLTEDSSPGSDFLASLCVDWEAAAGRAAAEGVRVVALRFGVVLAREGGAIAAMWMPFKLGLGGPLGPPGRWFPWVHADDAVGLARFALEREIAGPLNVVAPGSATMGEFAKTLGRVLRRPAVFPVPDLLLRLALGEMAAGLTPGQRVAPRAALAAGYSFRHAELAPALAALL